MKNNKFEYLYIVQGNYGYGFDDLTTHDTYKSARIDLKDYRANESVPHRIIQRRELKG